MKNSALEEISKKDTINFFVNVLKLIENTETLNPKVQQALFDAYTHHFLINPPPLNLLKHINLKCKK
jgi:hypothetical protein